MQLNRDMKKWPKSSDPTSFGVLNRSELMSRIKSSGNITTEFTFRNMLKANGIKGWRRNYPLYGKPDFAWPKLKIALFLDGCFWHGHNCSRNLSPKTNIKLWREKLKKVKDRDLAVNRYLTNLHWSVIRIWECELKINAYNIIASLRGSINSALHSE